MTSSGGSRRGTALAALTEARELLSRAAEETYGAEIEAAASSDEALAAEVRVLRLAVEGEVRAVDAVRRRAKVADQLDD